MTYTSWAYRLPRPLRRHILHFEVEIEDAVKALGAGLPRGARVLDAGAGEGQYRRFFAAQRYCGIDLAVGDTAWDYSGLDAVADLTALPFRDGAFEAALNIVTLEHLREPARALAEIARTLRPGSDSVAYINSRMARAGLQNQTVFSPELMEEIRLRTQGIPRLINAVCDNLLLTCFALETRTATMKMLDEVSADMHLDYPVARPLQLAPNFPETVIQKARVRFQAD